MKLRINTEDVIQIAIGTFALVVPISFTEEAWKISVTLPLYNVLLAFLLSVTFLTFMPIVVFSKDRFQDVTIYSYYVFSSYLIDIDAKLCFLPQIANSSQKKDEKSQV